MSYLVIARAVIAGDPQTLPAKEAKDARGVTEASPAIGITSREKSKISEGSDATPCLVSHNSLISRPEPHPESDSDEIEERTAVIEVEAGVPREWAEAVARLCSMPRPASIPEGRWRQLVDDSARFVECHGAAAAAAGWATLDIFGCCARRPLARIDMAGATAMLEGAEVVRVAADRIVLRRIGSKKEMSLYRGTGPNEARALLWELDGATGPRAIARSANA